MEDKKLILHYTKGSFFSQKVVFALKEKEIPFTSRIVNMAAFENITPEFMEMNKAGKIPVLEYDGNFIPESTVIIDYLEEHFGGRLLQPSKSTKEGKTVAKFQEKLESLNIGVLTFGAVYQPNLYKNIQIPETRKKNMAGSWEAKIKKLESLCAESDIKADIKGAYEEKIRVAKNRLTQLNDASEVLKSINVAKEVMDEIEKQLATCDEEWLCCKEFTVADIVLAITLRRFEMVGLQEKVIKADHPYLMKYFQRVKGRKTYIEVCTDPSTVIQKLKSFSMHPLTIGGVAVGAAVAIGIMKFR